MTPKGLAGVNTFVIPIGVLDRTIEFLQRAGESQVEGFVIWSGQVEDTTITLSSVVIPEQEAYRTESGLLVVVRGDALFTANKEAYDKGEILAVQVHTHPTSAYHSNTDDHYPLVTLAGALSIVIPDFARNAPHDIDRWAWYRLAGYGEWVEVGSETKIEIK